MIGQFVCYVQEGPYGAPSVPKELAVASLEQQLVGLRHRRLRQVVV